MTSGEGTEGTDRTKGTDRNERTTSNERTTGTDRIEGTPRGGEAAAMKGRVGPAAGETAAGLQDPAAGHKAMVGEGTAARAGEPGDDRTSSRTSSRTTDIPAAREDTGTRIGTAAGTATREGTAHGTGARLLPHDETDKLALRLQHAVGGFVDGPRASIEEADHVLEEAAERFTDAVTQRRRTLRASWQTTGEDSADTEQLRLALRDYREMTERLLRL